MVCLFLFCCCCCLLCYQVQSSFHLLISKAAETFWGTPFSEHVKNDVMDLTRTETKPKKNLLMCNKQNVNNNNCTTDKVLHSSSFSPGEHVSWSHSGNFLLHVALLSLNVAPEYIEFAKTIAISSTGLVDITTRSSFVFDSIVAYARSRPFSRVLFEEK